MGDAAGIGPEIIVKTLSNKNVYQLCHPIVIGSATIIQNALRLITPKNISPQISLIQPPKHITTKHGRIDVLNVSTLRPEDITFGTIDARCGAAAIQSIETAVNLTMDGSLDAITTAPICKAAIQRAGSRFPGHTEMLADFTKSEKTVMMLKTWDVPNQFDTDIKKEKKNGFISTNTVGNLTVTFVTNHIPISEVPKKLSVERIVDVIQITHDALLQFGIDTPRLVVTGLNPHAGEEGMFGNEEQTYLIPAINRARTTGLEVDGPLPADTLFKRVIMGEWDAVIAMYHDQGNIPIKLIGFGQIVNITLGLPIIRTSVDHGTAFDIAGKGIASEESLFAALVAAAQLASN